MFNALAMAHITNQHKEGMLTGWIMLQKDIEQAAYHGYDFYMLSPRQWCYMDRLREYGFEIVEDREYNFIARWDNI